MVGRFLNGININEMLGAKLAIQLITVFQLSQFRGNKINSIKN